MAYRSRSARVRRSVPLLLVGLGVAIALLGFLCAFLAVYLTAVAGSLPAVGDGAFEGLLAGPLVALFRAGLVTLGGGVVLLVGGGSAAVAAVFG